MTNDRINAIRARCDAATKALRDELYIGDGAKLISCEAANAIADTMDEMLIEIDRLTEALGEYQYAAAELAGTCLSDICTNDGLFRKHREIASRLQYKYTVVQPLLAAPKGE